MTRKRIALSVRPEYQEKLAKLAKYQDTTITTVVGDLLDECESAVDVILKAYAEIHKGVDKNKVLTNMLSESLGIASEKLKQE